MWEGEVDLMGPTPPGKLGGAVAAWVGDEQGAESGRSRHELLGCARCLPPAPEEGHWDLPLSPLPLAVPALHQRPETLTPIFEALVAGGRECSGGKRTSHAPSGPLPDPLAPTWRPCPAHDVGGA